jgi:hypothetical protein
MQTKDGSVEVTGSLQIMHIQRYVMDPTQITRGEGNIKGLGLDSMVESAPFRSFDRSKILHLSLVFKIKINDAL